MEKPEFSCAILSKLDLDDIEKVVKEAYHKEDGPGRPPRKPMGIFKALIVKRLQQVPSERELCRRMWKDDNIRELCDIEAEQNPYHPSQLSRFKKRVGARRLQRIMDKLLLELLKAALLAVKPWRWTLPSSRLTAGETHTRTVAESLTLKPGWAGTAKPTSSATNCTLQ
jgi:transposase